MKHLLVTTLVLLILQRSDSQTSEYAGQLRPCDAVFTDNLSCQNNVDALDTNDCLNRTQICDGSFDCLTGTTPSQIDESIGFNSLDCNTGIFLCASGIAGATISQLCDGNDDCGDGSDEVNIICENKCLFPYYGGCPMDRVCVTSESGRRCGSCLPGLTGGLFGPCFAVVNLTLDASIYNAAEGIPIVQVTISGSVGTGNLNDIAGHSFVVNLTLSNGTATGGLDFSTVIPDLTFDSNNLLMPQTVDITIIDDDLLEVTEIFDVSLNIVSGNDNSQIVFGISSATVSITDNDGQTLEYTGQLRPCDAVFTDNLSCQNIVDALDTNDCLNRTQICDGNFDCLTGTTPSQIDESIGFNSLDCNTGIFLCASGTAGATIDQICDGVDDCGDGSDEVNIICENKCLSPYYGGCPMDRECLTSESG